MVRCHQVVGQTNQALKVGQVVELPKGETPQHLSRAYKLIRANTGTAMLSLCFYVER